MMHFTEEQLERYSRHILLDDVGVAGQEKLMAAKVLIVGAGGLGSPAALYLAAAGVGTVGIVDSDVVEISNLQRQIAHHTSDIGISKVDSAAQKMTAINPDITVRTYREYLCAENISDIIREYDFVLDGTDNFPTKFLVNDACVFLRKPMSHGGILRFNGQTMTIIPGLTSCYRCSFRKPPPPDAVPSCAQAGVLGAVAGMLGTIQAAEALKFITGAGELLTDSLLTFDARTMAFRKIKLRRQENCPVCGIRPVITNLVDAEQATCSVLEKRQGAAC